MRSSWLTVFIWWNVFWAAIVFGPTVIMIVFGASNNGASGAAAGFALGGCFSTIIGSSLWLIWAVGAFLLLFGMVVARPDPNPATSVAEVAAPVDPADPVEVAGNRRPRTKSSPSHVALTLVLGLLAASFAWLWRDAVADGEHARRALESEDPEAPGFEPDPPAGEPLTYAAEGSFRVGRSHDVRLDHEHVRRLRLFGGYPNQRWGGTISAMVDYETRGFAAFQPDLRIDLLDESGDIIGTGYDRWVWSHLSPRSSHKSYSIPISVQDSRVIAFIRVSQGDTLIFPVR